MTTTDLFASPLDLLDHACVDVYPEELPGTADAPEGSLFLVLPTSKLWECGRVLDFAFLDGTDEQKATFRAMASEWSQHANLVMRFDQPPETSEFRVSFAGAGNWSYVGRDNLQQLPPTVTMNIQNEDSIRHEVGHAIGCVHEHSSPAGGIKWNKPVVYRALAGPPNNWDKAKVDHNVFRKYEADQTQFSDFDPSSVMLYFFPASWTEDGVGTTDNEELSETDKRFVKRCYPGCTADFSKQEIATGGCTVTYGPRVMFNSGYGNSWLMNQPNASFIEVSFDQPKTYDGADEYGKATLRLVHLTSMLGSEPGHSPVDIEVNGQVIAADHSPPSAGYLTEEWDVTDHLVDGPNVVRLSFKDARSNYWIQSLQVDCERILT